MTGVQSSMFQKSAEKDLARRLLKDAQIQGARNPEE
jgi:hypothetical protein